jgi:hypothetical protein
MLICSFTHLIAELAVSSIRKLSKGQPRTDKLDIPPEPTKKRRDPVLLGRRGLIMTSSCSALQQRDANKRFNPTRTSGRFLAIPAVTRIQPLSGFTPLARAG